MVKLHKTKINKWHEYVVLVQHSDRLRRLYNSLKDNNLFIEGFRRLHAKIKQTIEHNWICEECNSRITRRIYYESCKCHLCEDWFGFFEGHAYYEKVTYFCDICQKERPKPDHLKY